MPDFEDDYSIWSAAVEAGTPIPPESCHVDHPLSGRYRYRSKKTGEHVPVAYWRDGDGNLLCRYGNTMLSEQRANEIWPFCAKTPISQAVYKERLSTGRWPGESEAATQDRRNEPSEETAQTAPDVSSRLEVLAIEAEAMIQRGAAPDQHEADRAADLSDRLQKIEKRCTDLHKVDKEPHLEAGRVVDRTWFPLRDRAENLKKRLKAAVIGPFLKAKQDVLDAEHKRRQEAALTTDAPLPAAPPRAAAGSVGRKVTQRKQPRGEITDMPAFLLAIQNREDTREFCQGIANACARAGITLAGMKIIDGNTAA
jgi:hypothetical protein